MLQWGRDREVADSKHDSEYWPWDVRLQWGRDREVADSALG